MMTIRIAKTRQPRTWVHASEGSTLKLGEPSGMTNAQRISWMRFNGARRVESSPVGAVAVVVLVAVILLTLGALR